MKIFITSLLTVVLFILNSVDGICSDDGVWIQHRRQAPSRNILGFFTGADGNIWASTPGNLHSFDGSKWKLYDQEGYLTIDKAPFYLDDKGKFYFIDIDGLVVYDGTTFTRFDDHKINEPVYGTVDADGNLYIASYNSLTGGIYSFDGSHVTKIYDNRTKSIAFDLNDNLWCSALDPDSGNMLLLMREGEVWNDITDQVLSLYPVSTNELTVTTAPDGSVWVNNLKKHGVFKDGEWTFRDGGANSVPVFLYFDDSGVVWGYGYNKVYRLDTSNTWELIMTLNTGIPNNPNVISQTADSSIWTFDGIKVFRFDGEKFVIYKSENDMASNAVTCMAYTIDGELVCGYGIRGQEFNERENLGVSIYSSSSWISYNKHSGSYISNVYQLETMPSGDIFAYTDLGYIIYDGFSWDTVDSLSVPTQTDMQWDSMDNLWMTTTVGLAEYSDPGLKLYLPFDVWPLTVYNLTIDESDVKYMRYQSGEIISYSDETWESVIPSSSLMNSFTIALDSVFWAVFQYSLSFWNMDDLRWESVVDLDYGSLVDCDDQGRVWSSGFGNTGYYEDGEWHVIEELSDYASDSIVFGDDGTVVLNAFDRNRENFYGIFEYVASSEVDEVEVKPSQFMVTGNHPNPFNPTTSIYFELPRSEEVEISVFSLSGQLVKAFPVQSYMSGRNHVVWDATTDFGAPCASGVYFYRINAGAISQTGKMLLIR